MYSFDDGGAGFVLTFLNFVGATETVVVSLLLRLLTIKSHWEGKMSARMLHKTSMKFAAVSEIRQHFLIVYSDTSTSDIKKKNGGQTDRQAISNSKIQSVLLWVD